jgi:hypothetical protein
MSMNPPETVIEVASHDLFGVGARCLAFNHRVYVDDKTTPLSMTIQPGTVVNRRVEERRGRLLADVLFDSDPRVSKGHFADGLKSLPNAIAMAPPTLDSDLPKDVPGG